MLYKRRYIQFNNLVFGSVIDADDYTATWKTSDTEYGFIHGAYTPFKRKGGLLRSGRVSMTVVLNMQQLPCEDRPFYVRFVKNELATQGRLWAVQDNTLIWAYAYLTSYRESTRSRTNELEIDLNFELPEGVWHKADKRKTYLVPFDPCDFMDCYDYHEADPCVDNCCDCDSKPMIDSRCYTVDIACCDCKPIKICDCDCDAVTKEQSLCMMKDVLQKFYDCEVQYRVIYSCIAAKKYFGDFLDDNRTGQKFCNDCGGPISGRLYSDTDLPTDGVKITLRGEMQNPYIEINGNGNTIKGEYSGVLEIRPDGTVYAYKDENCPCEEPLPVDTWMIPSGMEYGWTVEQGYNRVIIDPGSCCHACAWIEVDALTF